MAKINIRLGKNFTTQFNKMLNEFGEEMAKINGFSDEQLSYTDFIDNFVDTDTVADASIDGNSNVGHKDIVTLVNEMPKPHQKLLAYNKIYYEINKEYGFKTANDWLQKEWDGHLYLHDANTASFIHYCYKGDETLTVKYSEEILYTHFRELYNIVKEEEKMDLNGNYYKNPENLFVLDYDNEGVCWTSVSSVSKSPNNKKMRFIKYANGNSQIVTEDHPVITTCGSIPAKDVTTEHQVFSIKTQRLENEIIDSIYTKEFGWIVGLCLAEGSAAPSVVTLKQTETKQRERLLHLLNKFSMPFSLDEDDRIRLRVCKLEKYIENLLLGKTAAYKQLPNNYMRLPSEFMDGVVAGLIDGDGTIDGYKHRHCQIRIASEVLCHQISNYLQSKGVFCGDRIPHIYKSTKSFEQKLPLFGIGFTLTNEDYFQNIGSIKINEKYEPLLRKGDFKNKRYVYDYGVIPVIENTEFIDSCPFVYDITTETHHFICNNILSHNCYAYDLKDVVEKGLFFIGNGFNPEPPKHLETFVDFVKEFVSWTCNRSSGAVGLPNLIPYMWYFWNKDVEEGYYTGTPERYAEQQIQRLIYALNQPFLRGGIQSAFTNTSIFDHPYYEALFGGSSFPDGSYMIDAEEKVIEFEKVFMKVMSNIRSHNMMTFPVNSISLLRQNGEFADKDFAIWACKHNMTWNDSNLFIDSSVNSLSNCCRLKSNIEDLGYFNSIGGSALKVGSVKVNTINLARLALENKTESEYLVALRDLVELDLKALDRVRYIIKRNVDKGLLQNFSYEIVDFEHLYNTIGFIGIYETMKTFGYTEEDELGNTYYTEKADIFGKKIFDVIHNVKDTFILDKDYMVNTEQIPGESAAAKLMNKDKFFYPDTTVCDLPLYGNQFIPLGIKTTLQERIRIASLFDGYCNGGSILHVNIDAPFKSFDTAWKMLNYIADQGITYFAFNTKIQACKHNHAFYGKKCPICGEDVDTEYTRIVGFYTPVKTYSKERKAEFKMREWEDINE